MILLLSLLALADPRLNPAVTPTTIRQTICVHGWAKRVRPPSSVIARLAKSLPPCPAGERCVIDHITPIEIGGAPRNLRNLQRQTLAESKAKNIAENDAHRAICSGKVGLRDAQRAIVGWRP